jgi:hypothetical protein
MGPEGPGTKNGLEGETSSIIVLEYRTFNDEMEKVLKEAAMA